MRALHARALLTLGAATFALQPIAIEAQNARANQALGTAILAKAAAAAATSTANSALATAGATGAAGQGYVPVTLTSSDGNTLVGTVPGGVTVGPRSLVGFTANAVGSGAATLQIGATTRTILDRGGSALTSLNPLVSGTTYIGEVSPGGTGIRQLSATRPSLAQLNAASSTTTALTPADIPTILANSVTPPVTLTSSGTDTFTGTTPSGVEPQVGQIFAFVANFTNVSTAPTLQLNGGTVRTIYQSTGSALQVGEIASGTAYLLIRTASAYKLVGAASASTAQIDAASNNSAKVTPLTLAYFAGTLPVQRDPTLLQVQVAPSSGAGGMKIFVPAKSATRYVEWRFVDSIVSANNLDAWRIGGVYDDTLNAAGVSTRVQSLARTAEFECPVRLYGNTNFSCGASHYNQIKSAIACYADGIAFDPTSTVNFTARVLECYQTSTLYNPGSGTTATYSTADPIMTIYERWRWTSAGLRLTVTGTVIGARQFDAIYFGIFPWFHNNSGSSQTGATQDIVNKGRRSPLYVEEDLSGNTSSGTITQADELLGYGGGYTMREKKLSGYDAATAPLRQTRFDATVDNKGYFNQVGATSSSSFTNSTPAPASYADGAQIGPVVSEYEITDPN